MFLKLQIQIRVGKATRKPMFFGNNFACFRLELIANFAAPRAVFKDLACPTSLLDRRDILLRFVIARTISMMERIENPKPRLPRRIQNFEHVRNALVSFRNALDTVPYLSAVGNEVVVRIDDQKCRDLFQTSTLPYFLAYLFLKM